MARANSLWTFQCKTRVTSIKHQSSVSAKMRDKDTFAMVQQLGARVYCGRELPWLGRVMVFGPFSKKQVAKRMLGGMDCSLGKP